MANLIHRFGEKSNFAQTCNLLSQYLKERGSFGNFNLVEANKGQEVSRTHATTLNLLPSMENKAENSSRLNSVPSENIKSMEFLPQFVGDFTSNVPADLMRKSSRVDNPETAQMTIFYRGKVISFDDFPAEKANEIISLACKANNSTPPSLNKVRERFQLRPQVNGSDLPIARRVSLHRFLEKRKDRVASNAPYQINHPSSQARPEQRNDVFIDLECPSSKQLELKL
jgi:jasmonate ZIM domain-containing protein